MVYAHQLYLEDQKDYNDRHTNELNQHKCLISLKEFTNNMPKVKKDKLEEKMKEVDKKMGPIKQYTYNYAYLISRALERPFEVFLNDSLSFCVGFEFIFNSNAIQVEMIPNETDISWSYIDSKCLI